MVLWIVNQHESALHSFTLAFVCQPQPVSISKNVYKIFIAHWQLNGGVQALRNTQFPYQYVLICFMWVWSQQNGVYFPSIRNNPRCDDGGKQLLLLSCYWCFSFLFIALILPLHFLWSFITRRFVPLFSHKYFSTLSSGNKQSGKRCRI